MSWSELFAGIALYLTILSVPAFVAYFHPGSYRRLLPFAITGLVWLIGTIWLGWFAFELGASTTFAMLSQNPAVGLPAVLNTRVSPVAISLLIGVTLVILLTLSRLPDWGIAKRQVRPPQPKRGAAQKTDDKP